MERNFASFKSLLCGEVSHIWMGYQYETIHLCGITFFLQHVEDDSIRKTLEEGFKLKKQRIKKMTELFKKYDQLLPKGFSVGDDVNLEAPRIFSDDLYLDYMMNVIQLELVNYTLAFRDAMNPDVLDFYQQLIKESMKLELKTKMLAKEKGIYIQSPKIPKQTQNELVEKESFIAGWFGDKRPLLGSEIAQLVLHSKRNALGQAVITAFSQVAKSKEVRKFFKRGSGIAKKHLEVFTSKLHENELPNSSILLTAEVTDSTVSPFSDKLMTILITSLITAGIGGYGLSLSISPRRDLSVDYTRLMAEIATYSDDGAELLIKNGWMEKPPIAADRKGLAN